MIVKGIHSEAGDLIAHSLHLLSSQPAVGSSRVSYEELDNTSRLFPLFCLSFWPNRKMLPKRISHWICVCMCLCVVFNSHAHRQAQRASFSFSTDWLGFTCRHPIHLLILWGEIKKKANTRGRNKRWSCLGQAFCQPSKTHSTGISALQTGHLSRFGSKPPQRWPTCHLRWEVVLNILCNNQSVSNSVILLKQHTKIMANIRAAPDW